MLPDIADRYTVGWIAPMALALTPAIALLEDYGTADVEGDGVVYHTGRIGQHHVVMVVCPMTGLSPATSTATNMRRSFPSIEHILVVGIAGGVPFYGHDRCQIVLGDVVVSAPQKSEGGVKHYEFGTWVNATDLSGGGHTLHPSRALLGAVNNLQVKHAIFGSSIPQYLCELREKLIQKERNKHNDPESLLNDRLFESNYIHSDRDQTCQERCDFNNSKLRKDRGEDALREKDSPVTHYGTIGSANALVISSEKRDQLYRDFKIICVEMESAGVMSEHQGLVVRGICNYADSHKNKKWQKYAAATAAAYAKELLLLVPGGIVKGPRRRVSEVFTALDKIHADMAELFVKMEREDLIKTLEKISTVPFAGHHKFTSDKRLDGTAEWILQCDKFQQWHTSEASAITLLYGQPGAGKTFLVSRVIDHIKEQESNLEGLPISTAEEVKQTEINHSRYFKAWFASLRLR